MHNVFGGGIYFERAELKQQFEQGQSQLLCVYCCAVALDLLYSGVAPGVVHLTTVRVTNCAQ